MSDKNLGNWITSSKDPITVLSEQTHEKDSPLKKNACLMSADKISSKNVQISRFCIEKWVHLIRYVLQKYAIQFWYNFVGRSLIITSGY